MGERKDLKCGRRSDFTRALHTCGVRSAKLGQLRKSKYHTLQTMSVSKNILIFYQTLTMHSTRIVHHAKQLIDLIFQFPKVNPSYLTASDLDIPRLFRQIRSRYKVLCATLGIRPTLHASGASSPPDESEQEALLTETSSRADKNKVWAINPSRPARQGGGEDLSF